MENWFNWLTLEWLMSNLEWIVLGMLVGLMILLCFPILLTIEFKKLNKKDVD
tara:strand:+ start:630 stop:785 length:156 start_codon:yes stop_codon:yes gene_type:complete